MKSIYRSQLNDEIEEAMMFIKYADPDDLSIAEQNYLNNQKTLRSKEHRDFQHLLNCYEK